jgi:uncharacterized protein (TIGR00661 family)
MNSATAQVRPQRVVVGACGMGNGHSSRQLSLVAHLRRRGHQVVIVTFGEGVAALAGAFDTPVPVLEPTHFPGGWVPALPDGLDIAGAARAGKDLDPRGDAWNFGLCERVIEALGGVPDAVLTDYEPASAQIAYMTGARLITTEQQSKFLMYRTPGVGGFTRGQEAAKLRYFFPAADLRVASSFFPMEWERDERFAGEVTAPILRPDVLDLVPEVDEGLVLVYLSPWAAVRGDLRRAPAMFGAHPGKRFVVFSAEDLGPVPANVETRRFDRAEFGKALASCSAVIATAGHQLLSECVYLGKPVLALPFDVYEQRFNAAMVERWGFGVSADELSPERLRTFLERRDAYAEAAAELGARHRTAENVEDLLDRLGF